MSYREPSNEYFERILQLSEDFRFNANPYSAWDHAVDRVKNLTNLNEVPKGLEHVVFRIALGEYLETASLGGLIPSEAVPALVKQITEGDTTVTFAVSEGATGTALLKQLIDDLKNGYMDEIYRYRRLLW